MATRRERRARKRQGKVIEGTAVPSQPTTHFDDEEQARSDVLKHVNEALLSTPRRYLIAVFTVEDEANGRVRTKLTRTSYAFPHDLFEESLQTFERLQDQAFASDVGNAVARYVGNLSSAKNRATEMLAENLRGEHGPPAREELEVGHVVPHPVAIFGDE